MASCANRRSFRWHTEQRCHECYSDVLGNCLQAFIGFGGDEAYLYYLFYALFADCQVPDHENFRRETDLFSLLYVFGVAFSPLISFPIPGRVSSAGT